MSQHRRVITLIVSLMFCSFVSFAAHAQQPITGTVIAAANVRNAAGNAALMTFSLAAGTRVTVEARSGDAVWLLIRTDKGKRGWLRVHQVEVSAAVEGLPVSDEVVGQAAAGAPTRVAAAQVVNSSSSGPVAFPKNPSTYAAQITPDVRAAMRAVFERGQKNGTNARVFTRVGDCLSGGGWFMQQFGDGGPNNWGPHHHLQNVLGYYSVSPRAGVANSFVLVSQAEHGGFTSRAVNDPIWADPAVCNKGESPLRCEYRVTRPAVAIIMFGIVDVQTGTTLEDFRSNMQQAVDTTLSMGIIPILSTAPQTPQYADKAQQFNQVVIHLARTRRVPLINLAAALDNFPDKGLDPDGIHLTPALKYTRVEFSSMKDGFTVWNYLALQSLYNVWQNVMK